MTGPIFEYVTMGIIFGLMAGISPGPLLTLVISETLRHGDRAGMRMAMVPVITDLPIVLLSLLILARLAKYEQVLGIISLLGAIFLVYLALENILIKQVNASVRKPANKGFIKGIISNFLSPHPYIFWILIGGSIILRAAEISIILACVFVLLFYVCLVGSKIVVALLTHRFSNILSTRFYTYTIRLLGIVLLGFAVYFFIEGVNYIF